MAELTWFEITAKENFEAAFLPASNQPNLKYLQLGVFRGDASVWLMENVLTHPSSKLTDVDSWKSDSPELAEYDMSQVFGEYLDRVQQYSTRLEVKMQDTLDFLAHAIIYRPLEYNFIYIDADHAAVSTLENAVMSYRLLKPGGIMCFDDYLWKSKHGMLHEPQMAIDVFKMVYGDRMMVLNVGAQCWMKKVM